MTATDARPAHGLSGETAQLYEAQPPAVRQAYLDWFDRRENRKSAHRDTLEAFLGGWAARERFALAGTAAARSRAKRRSG